jgi:hypothetical protein
MKNEFNVGDIFQFGFMKLKCVESTTKDCHGCVLSCTNPCKKFVGECAFYKRQDGKDVMFIEVKEKNNG